MLKSFKPVSLILVAGAMALPISAYADPVAGKPKKAFSQQEGKISHVAEYDFDAVTRGSFMPTQKSSKIRGTNLPQQVKKIITGTVVDKDNLPLPGVNVWLKNSTVGVTTDVDGNISSRSKMPVGFLFSHTWE